jgi:hypothetical protein
LLPSIVFASGSLLACGGRVDVVLPDVPPPLPDVDGATDVDATPPPIAPDAGVEPDARSCEPGWHTTKGQICVTDGGLECCSRIGDEDAGSQCCPVQK